MSRAARRGLQEQGGHITEEQLLKAALANLKEDATTHDVLNAVFYGWVALRDDYIEELTLHYRTRYQDEDRLARWGRRIQEKAARVYGIPFSFWETAYCYYECEDCEDRKWDNCDRKWQRDQLCWTAAGTIATVVYIHQENTDTLPFPSSEPSKEAILAHWEAHPRMKFVAGVYAEQVSLGI